MFSCLHPASAGGLNHAVPKVPVQVCVFVYVHVLNMHKTLGVYPNLFHLGFFFFHLHFDTGVFYWTRNTDSARLAGQQALGNLPVSALPSAGTVATAWPIFLWMPRMELPHQALC